MGEDNWWVVSKIPIERLVFFEKREREDDDIFKRVVLTDDDHCQWNCPFDYLIDLIHREIHEDFHCFSHSLNDVLWM